MLNFRHRFEGNQLKGGAIISYVSLIIGNVVGLTYTPFMLRSMGQEEYGLYSLIASIVAYLTVLDFGFGNAIIRYTAKYKALKKEKELSYLLGMFLILYLVIACVALLLGSVFYLNIERLFNRSMSIEEIEKAKTMIVYLIINVAITFPMSIYGATIAAYEKFVFLNLLSIVRIVLNPLLMTPFLLLGYKAIAMVLVISFINILILVVNCCYYYKVINIKISFGKFDKKLLKEITVYSFYVFLGLIVGKIYWSAGQFILGMVTGTIAVAIYAVAIQLQTYFMSFSSTITNVFLPRITSMFSNNCTEEEISELFIKVGRMQVLITFYILCAFVLCGKEFIVFWAGQDYAEAYSISLIIMIPLTFTLIQSMGMVILQAKNQQKFRSLLNLCIAIVGLVVSYYLSIAFGGIGCAIGTSFALFVGNVLIMNVYYYKRIGINIPVFWTQVAEMLFPIIAILITCLIVKEYFELFSLIEVTTLIVCYSLAYFYSVWKYSMNMYEKGIVISLLKIK